MQLKAKDYFAFFAITEPATSHLATMAQGLARGFSAFAQAEKYGEGVKSITATLVLSNPDGLGRNHKVPRPKYSPGIRSIRAHGLTVLAEDTLEFGLRPSVDGIEAANGEVQLAAAIASAMTGVKQPLLALEIPNFATARFLADLEQYLAQYGRNH